MRNPTKYGNKTEVVAITKSYLRGYEIELFRGEWVYSDTKEPTVETWQNRPCGFCGKYNTPEGHDACLGTLPGVMNACCGHGQTGDAYVQFSDGHAVYGEEAIAVMNELKRGDTD